MPAVAERDGLIIGALLLKVGGCPFEGVGEMWFHGVDDASR